MSKKTNFPGRTELVPVEIENDLYEQQLAELAEILYGLFCSCQLAPKLIPFSKPSGAASCHDHNLNRKVNHG
ncbi:MAG: hypothetical protein HY537_03840 [Deltaproteobacteria bacterium]|nr:hypothetical protein [Deltaproteobacteria bacterium]